MYSIVEFGTGPHGEDDDRPLGTSGRFLEGHYEPCAVAKFPNEEAAAFAAASAFGARDAGHIGLVKVIT